MRTRLLNSFMNVERLRLLPWALAAVLLVTQFWSGAHKALLDAHEAGQYCQACVLSDRDDAPVVASTVIPEFAPAVSDSLSDVSPDVDHHPSDRLPPSRAPPLLIS